MRAASHLLVIGLLLAFPRVGVSQTADIQKDLEALLVLKRAGALLTVQDGTVTQVSLSGLRRTGRLLEQVKGLSKLDTLELAGSDVTDQDLEKVRDLTNLRVLNLASTRIGDAGLAHLKGLKRLTALSLYGTRVTDKGVEHLKGLAGLKEVTVNGTRFTPAGSQALQNALQGVIVIGAK